MGVVQTQHDRSSDEQFASTPASQLDIDQLPESRCGSRAVSVHGDGDQPPINNPLVSGPSAYTAVTTGQTRKFDLGPRY